MTWATLSSISAWRRTDEINESWGWASDFFGDVSNLLEVIAPEGADYEQWSQEFRLSGSAFGDKLDWTAGIYAFQEDNVQPGGVPLFRGAPAPTPAESPIFHAVPTLAGIAIGTQIFGSRNQVLDAENASEAIYFEGTYHVTDRFDVTAGLRYTRDHREFTRIRTLSDGSFDPGNACPGNNPVVSDRCFQEKDFSKSTPRLILSYRFTDDVMVYGSLSRGYSSVGFNGDIQMQPYAPENSDNLEIGLKSTLWNQRLRLNATAFYNDYENQQITVARNFNNQPTAAIINAQKATLRGVELEMTVLPWEGWAFSATYGFLDGEYDEFVIQDQETDPLTNITVFRDRDLKDTEFVRGSPLTFSIHGAYSHRFRDGGGINAGLGWSFRGRQFNTLETLRSSRQGKYGLLDGRLTWQFANNLSSLSLWGTNLLDRAYYFGAVDLSGGAAPSHTVSKYYAPPRRFGLEIRHEFGE